jgi:hypothetical protein
MRRASLLIASIVAAAAVSACGGDDSNPQVDAITKTYSTYIGAVKSGDGELACSKLTPSYQRRAASLVVPAKQKALEGASCPQAIEATPRKLLESFEPNLTEVEIKGDRATGLDPGENQFQPQKLLFRRLDGDWKISATIYTQGGPVS